MTQPTRHQHADLEPDTTMVVHVQDTAGQQLLGVDMLDYSTMKTLTCENHRDLRWTTKGHGRSLLFLGRKTPDGMDLGVVEECPCSYFDMFILA